MFPYVPQACCIFLSLLSSLGQDSCSRDRLSSGPTSGHGDDTVMITAANLTDKRNSRWVYIYHESLKYLILVWFFFWNLCSVKESPQVQCLPDRSQSSTASNMTPEKNKVIDECLECVMWSKSAGRVLGTLKVLSKLPDFTLPPKN